MQQNQSLMQHCNAASDCSSFQASHLIESPLLEEDLEHEHQGLHGWQGVHEVPHKASCNRPIGHIKADVKVDAALLLNKLDDGHLSFCNHLQAALRAFGQSKGYRFPHDMVTLFLVGFADKHHWGKSGQAKCA